MMDAEAFAAYVETETAALDGVTVEEREGLVLHVQVEGFSLRCDLTTAYQAYLGSPDRLDDLVSAHLSAVRSVPGGVRAGLQDVLERVYPLLKPIAYRSVVKAQGMPDLVHRRWWAKLMVAYVIDAPRSMAYITTEQLNMWGIEAARLHELALDNLRRRTMEDGGTQYVLAGDGVETICMSQSQDGYDATRVLVPDVLDEWASYIPAPLLLGIPNRDFLIGFSGRDRGIASKITRQVRQDSKSRDHGLTDQIFVWRNNRVEPWDS